MSSYSRDPRFFEDTRNWYQFRSDREYEICVLFLHRAFFNLQMRLKKNHTDEGEKNMKALERALKYLGEEET